MLPIGSATKGFNCAAIYRLVDQGKIKLDDFAYIYIDQVLQREFDTTMFELFGAWGEEITVRELVFMRAGVSDLEVGDYNKDVLSATPKDYHSVLEMLQSVVDLPEKNGC